MLPDEPETGHKGPQNDTENKRIQEERAREERRQREIEEEQRRNRQKKD
jgi:hypothetical protein